MATQDEKLDKLREIIDDYERKTIESNSFPEEIINARKSYIDYMKTRKDIMMAGVENNPSPKLFDKLDEIRDEWFLICEIKNDMMLWDIAPFNLGIDLRQFIGGCMFSKNIRLINNLINLIGNDIFRLEPEIILMSIDKGIDGLTTRFIEMKGPIEYQDYRGFFLLACNGKLEMLEKILETYEIDEITKTNIIGKSVVMAIKYSKINILAKFCPKEDFRAVPHIMFQFLLMGIERERCSLDVVKYFVNNGVNVRQQNYAVVNLAKQLNRGDILNFLETLTYDEILQDYLKKINRPQITCAISQKPLNRTDIYKCKGQKTHYYQVDVWNKWMMFPDSKWSCPRCFADIDKNMIFYE